MYTIYTQNLCGYCTAAKRLMQEHNYKYKEININEPKNPHSSAKTQKIKSVFCSGTCLYLSLLKVPFKYPK